MQQSMRHGENHRVPFTYLVTFMQDQGKLQECENHVNNVQMRLTDETWWMMSQTSHTKQSHKSITQLNHIE